VSKKNKEKTAELTSGDGTLKNYSFGFIDHKSNRVFRLRNEIKKNGTKKKYFYDDNLYVKKIQYNNLQDSLTFGEFTFDYNKWKDRLIEVTASNGRKVNYHFKENRFTVRAYE